jgi:hypothetical protein
MVQTYEQWFLRARSHHTFVYVFNVNVETMNENLMGARSQQACVHIYNVENMNQNLMGAWLEVMLVLVVMLVGVGGECWNLDIDTKLSYFRHRKHKLNFDEGVVGGDADAGLEMGWCTVRLRAVGVGWIRV